MKKVNIVLSILMLFVASTAISQSTDAPFEQGGEPGLLPFVKKGFHPQVSIAPQVAYMNFYDGNMDGIGYGVEIALQCPLACTSKNYIRQQASFLYFEEGYLTTWEATLNPEYRFVVQPTFEFAAGPSLGMFHGESNFPEIFSINYSKNYFSYGISTSATFHLGDKIFTGISARQNWVGDNFSHFQGILKVGYKL